MTAVSVAGVSVVEIPEPLKPVVYAGLLQDSAYCTSADLAGSNTCNSCAGMTSISGTQYACNEKAIHDNTVLAVSLTLNAAPSTTVVVDFTPTSSSTATIISTDVTVTGTIGVGTQFTVSIPWSQICAVSSSSPCTAATFTEYSGTLRVGLAASGATTLDTANAASITVNMRKPTSASFPNYGSTATSPDNAYYKFEVFPGDEKVYLLSPVRDGTKPESSGTIYWKAIRVFYTTDAIRTNAITGINPSSGRHHDVPITDIKTKDSTLQNGSISGLANGIQYYFTVGTVDQAGNIEQIIGGGWVETIHSATPTKVVGLLDGKKCFIATAAFGSEWAPPVEILRNFRDQILLPNPWGKRFVQFYYAKSPEWAEWLKKNETARTFVRTLLWPVVTSAALFLEGGGWYILLLGVFGSLYFLFRSQSRREL